jgi:hypothetical protein
MFCDEYFIRVSARCCFPNEQIDGIIKPMMDESIRFLAFAVKEVDSLSLSSLKGKIFTLIIR